MVGPQMLMVGPVPSVALYATAYWAHPPKNTVNHVIYCVTMVTSSIHKLGSGDITV